MLSLVNKGRGPATVYLEAYDVGVWLEDLVNESGGTCLPRKVVQRLTCVEVLVVPQEFVAAHGGQKGIPVMHSAPANSVGV